jgi:hypothetical protein
MNRIRWFVVAVLVLLTANFATRWWKNRGLITIHCEDWPASKVVRELEKQGGITIKTNLTDETRIRMHLDKVPLTEAMETFAVVSEGRWRLTYVFAGGLGEIQNGINAMLANERPEGWKRLYFPMRRMGNDFDAGPAPDPRTDLWNVKTPEKDEFQSYAQQAARSVNAAIAFPETWNPSVHKQPSAGPIAKVAPALAKASGGRVLEVFLVQKNERRDDQDDGDQGPRFGFRGDNADEAERDRRREAFIERAQAEIDKLPPEQRQAAQQRFEERRKFFEGMRDLPEAQRRAKMEEFFSGEQNQERMEARESERMARMTPDQRVDRSRRYVERKQAARSGTTNR